MSLPCGSARPYWICGNIMCVCHYCVCSIECNKAYYNLDHYYYYFYHHHCYFNYYSLFFTSPVADLEHTITQLQRNRVSRYLSGMLVRIYENLRYMGWQF